MLVASFLGGVGQIKSHFSLFSTRICKKWKFGNAFINNVVQLIISHELIKADASSIHTSDLTLVELLYLIMLNFTISVFCCNCYVSGPGKFFPFDSKDE